MGLELGPPWLVLVTNEGGVGHEILVRDNFTGAAMKRVASARRSEPGSVAAVMDRDGRLARHPGGALYDPIEETKGRNGGTDAERGHIALLTAQGLFKMMDGATRHEAYQTPPSVLDRFGKAFLMTLFVTVALVALANAI